MPYKRNAELPRPVRDALPTGAQSIYRATFNASAGKGDERASAIAWAAVKKSYRKDRSGRWVKR